MTLPENRQPLNANDMAKLHSSTWEAEAKALRAENERLREALRIVDRNLTNLQPKIPDMVYGDWIKVIDAYVDPAISASRQALKGKDDE